MFRQMVFVNKTQEPVDRFRQLAEEKQAWNRRVAKEVQEIYRRRVVTITDHLTGSDFVAGIEDSGIQLPGWSKYGHTPYLVPTRNAKGNKTRELIRVLGTSPPILKNMVEEFDLPPYYRTQREVFYPGFDLLLTDMAVYHDGNLAEEGKEGLFILYNVWPPDHGGKVWEGNDYFEQSTMERYYGLKGF